MVSSRPLLYMSLPGVALILGVFWFRRRNKKRLENGEVDSSGSNQKTVIKKGKNQEQNDKIKQRTEDNESMKLHKASTANVSLPNIKAEEIPIMSIMSNGGNLPPDIDENLGIVIFGKSAPIEITHNGRNNKSFLKDEQNKQQQPQIDSDILKTKIQYAENQILRSIDEDLESLCSSVDLPGSIQSRKKFHTRTKTSQRDEPIVIKATRTPKISPENSFLDSKYIISATSEQNNNCEQKTPTSSDKNQQGIETEKIKHKKCKSVKTVSNYSDMQTQRNDITTAKDCCLVEKEAAAGEANANIVSTEDNCKQIVASGSPVLSLCSVQSGDSGTGSSLPRSEDARTKSTYEFFFPNSLIGYLYGPKRCFINKIKSKTSTSIVIRKNPYSSKLRICSVEGADCDVYEALLMIRQRIPIKKYPNFTMQKIHYALPQSIVPLSTENLLNLQLNLIEGINNDVLVSAIISGCHIFLQHPLHPSHPSLPVLQASLLESYSSFDAPLLPNMEINAVCVLSTNKSWYRVQIVEQDADDEQRCVVKFLDFGGYINVHFNDLRQIRSDFMAVPFQATECILSNIEPIDVSRTQEVSDVLCKLTKGIVLQAQVAGYNSNSIPEIFLFACLGPNNVIFINKELVARNLAKWVETL